MKLRLKGKNGGGGNNKDEKNLQKLQLLAEYLRQNSRDKGTSESLRKKDGNGKHSK